MSDYLEFNAPGEGHRTCAHIDYKRMSGIPATGFYRWKIELSIAMNRSGEYQILPDAVAEITADLHLAGSSHNELLVARFAMSENRNEVIGNRRGPTENFSLEGDVDARCIAAIEIVRKGESLPLILKLTASAVDTKTGARYPAKATIRLYVTQSDWSAVLQGMQYRRTLLLEVPAPEEWKDPVLADAAKHLESASKQLSQGHYRQSVSECRHVLESLKSHFSDSGEETADEKKLNKEQRLARVNTALMRLTHLAHHVDEVSKQTEWRPVDARAILMMTGSLLQMASKDGE